MSLKQHTSVEIHNYVLPAKAIIHNLRLNIQVHYIPLHITLLTILQHCMQKLYSELVN